MNKIIVVNGKRYIEIKDEIKNKNFKLEERDNKCLYLTVSNNSDPSSGFVVFKIDCKNKYIKRFHNTQHIDDWDFDLK